MTRPSLAERFWEKVDRSCGPDGCWLWIAGRHPQGYGNFSLNGETVHAQRIAWCLTHGQIPEGLSVLHRCDNPPCVNPAHLFLGTQLANVLDMVAKGRAFPLPDFNRSKTHCPAGHEYSDANTYRYASGRRCKTCVRARMNARYRRQISGRSPVHAHRG